MAGPESERTRSVEWSDTWEVATVSESDESTKLFQSHVDRDLHESADFDWGEKTSWLEQMLKFRVYGEEFVAAEVKREIATEQWEDTESGIVSVLSYLETIAGDGGAVTIETVYEEFDAFREEREDAIAKRFEEPAVEIRNELEAEQDEAFEEKLEAIENELREGCHVFPEHGMVEDASTLRGIDPEEVIDLLKERNPDIPAQQFEAKSGNSTTSSSGLRSVATDGGEPR